MGVDDERRRGLVTSFHPIPSLQLEAEASRPYVLEAAPDLDSWVLCHLDLSAS